MEDSSILRNILDNPRWHVAIALPVGYVALTATITLPAVAGLLTAILSATYDSHLRRDRAHLAAMWLSVTIGGTLARLGPSLSALSTAWSSILLSSATIALMNGVGLFVLIGSSSVTHSVSFAHGWVRLCVFPVAWTILGVVESQSPLGRLVTWTPANGYALYEWMLPYFGPPALDWLAAAWGVAVTELIAYRVIIPYRDGPNNEASVKTFGPRRYAPTLITFLIALTLPGMVKPPVPVVAPSIHDTTALGVGCILPQTSFDHSALEYYINATKNTISSNVRLLLWPEGAVTVGSRAEKAEMFARIRTEILKNNHNIWIAVSYIEPALEVPGKYLNSFTVINITDELFTYHKRNLVPLVESYGQVTIPQPPEVFDMPITVSKSRSGKTRVTHDVPLSAGICLDFASSLPALPRKPALILAPAHTWHADIGETMAAQARLRAHELGSHVLWCDGGAGGRSALFGPDGDEVYQIGDGTWVKTFRLPHPFEERPTPYAAFGSLISLLLLCVVVPFLPLPLTYLFQLTAPVLHRASSRLNDRIYAVFHRNEGFVQRQEAGQDSQEASPPLIDV